MLFFTAGRLIAPGIPVNHRALDLSLVRGAFKHGVWWTSTANGMAARIMRGDVRLSPLHIRPEADPTNKDILLHLNHEVVEIENSSGSAIFLTKHLLLLCSSASINLICSEIVGPTPGTRNWYDPRFQINHSGNSVTYRTRGVDQKIELLTAADGTVNFKITGGTIST